MVPRTADHPERHRRIALAVWALIARGGIESVTLRAVAGEAGMSLGQLQHYVANRTELIRRACAAMIDLAAEAYGEEAPEDPLGRIRTILVMPFATSEAARIGVSVWHAFLAKSVDDSEIARLINEARAQTENEIGRLLEASGHDSTWARALVALSDGLSERTLTGGLGTQEAEAEIDRALAALAMTR